MLPLAPSQPSTSNLFTPDPSESSSKKADPTSDSNSTSALPPRSAKSQKNRPTSVRQSSLPSTVSKKEDSPSASREDCAGPEFNHANPGTFKASNWSTRTTAAIKSAKSKCSTQPTVSLLPATTTVNLCPSKMMASCSPRPCWPRRCTYTSRSTRVNPNSGSNSTLSDTDIFRITTLRCFRLNIP